MHNLEVLKLHEITDAAEFKRLKVSQMITSENGSVQNSGDPDLSADSESEDAEQKYAILQLLEGGNGIITEEEEGADYDECFPQNSESTEELPLIRDVDRSKFGIIE